MNVGLGGKQPIMRDTSFNGQVQKMVNSNGIPKGMKLVLHERGVDTTGMKAAQLREELKEHPDFKQQKNILEEYIDRRRRICLYLLKFHCELSLIECVQVLLKEAHPCLC